MENTLIDNTENLKLLGFIKKALKATNCNELKIATGYWDLPGTKLLLEELNKFFEKGGKLKLLIGQEPELRTYQHKKNSEIEESEIFPDFYIQRDINTLTDEYRPVAELLQKYMSEKDDKDAQMRVHVYGQDGEKKFLHAKCYIFNGVTDEGKKALGIIGSSNFTKNGLTENAELNYLETDKKIVNYNDNDDPDAKGHNAWFEEKWADSVPWSGKFLKETLNKKFPPKGVGEPEQPYDSPKITPYEIYIKYLQTQFGDIIDPNIDNLLKRYLPTKYTSYEYQLEAVKQCYGIMRLHHGFILADVVGLGKTVVGMLLIKRFLEEAEKLNMPRKVLLITPPAIQKGWKDTLDDFNKDAENIITDTELKFITTGKIESVSDFSETEDDTYDDDADDFDSELESDNYGLIIIDESHNFRNADTTKYKQLTELIDKIEGSVGQPYVGLLSATPQNNSPKDLLNQIRLFQRDGRASTLNGIPDGNIVHYFTEKENKFNELRNELRITNAAGKSVTDQDKLAELKQLAKEIHDDVLQDLVVRRTRSDIMNSKRFKEDSKHLKFPKVAPIHELTYDMSPELATLFAQTIYAISPSEELENIFKGLPLVKDKDLYALGFYRFKALNYLNAETKKNYEKNNLKVTQITGRLEKLMQMLLVKRLESSFKAFRSSLLNLKIATKNMIDMFENDTIFICKNIEVHKIIEEEGGLQNAIPKLRNKIANKGGNNRELRRTNFDLDSENGNLIELLKEDYKALGKLCDKWGNIDEDPKKDAFTELVSPKDESHEKSKIDGIVRFFDEDINCPSKNDSQKLVVFTEAIDTQESVAQIFRKKGYRVLVVNADNRKELQNVIQENFDANYKGEWKYDKDVIVTTEVLAEGVNLHRSNCILNYDTPWNATRLMQRIGRVNRLGSKEDEVHVFNFKPTAESDSLINLVSKSYAKLQSFHTMFGEDSQAYSNEEEVGSVQFIHDIDDETSPEGEFIIDLKTFHEKNPNRYDYLSMIELKENGGMIKDSSRDYNLAVVHSEKGKSVAIIIRGNKTESVSSLSFMGKLKCPETSEFIELNGNKRNELFNLAMNRFETDTTATKTFKKESKEYKKAKELLSNVDLKQLNQESKIILKNIRTAASEGNAYVINTLLKNQKLLEASLFGHEFEDWISTAFASLKTEAKTKSGNYYVQFYEA